MEERLIERKEEITLIVKDMAAIPEGSAAMINHLYDSEEAVIEDKAGLARRLTLTVDIGAITTDISAVENSRSVGTICFGMEKGIYHALDKIIGGYRKGLWRLQAEPPQAHAVPYT